MEFKSAIDCFAARTKDINSCLLESFDYFLLKSRKFAAAPTERLHSTQMNNANNANDVAPTMHCVAHSIYTEETS